MSAVNISTKRTAINVTVVLWMVSLVNRIFGWKMNLTDQDVIWLAPAIGAVVGVGYRLSRWATAKWPTLGWVLFGSGKEPEGMKPIGK